LSIAINAGKTVASMQSLFVGRGSCLNYALAKNVHEMDATSTC
jgi:hypothetical protein